MAHPQTTESGNESLGNYAEDGSTPKTDQYFFLLDQTHDPSLQTAEEELFSQETSRDASTQNTKDDCSLLEQFNWEENYCADTSETSEEKRKRKISSEEEITHHTDAYKLSRPEVWGISDQVISNISDNGFSNPDSGTNEITMSGQIAFGPGSFEFSNSEFPNFEESHSKNQELIASDCLDKDVHLSTGQSTAYNKNIFQKEDATCKVRDTNVFKTANVSLVDMLAVPDTSRCRDNNSNTNLSVKKLHKGSPLKQQPPVETEQKEPTCITCRKTISEHVEKHDGKDMYKCCRCEYGNVNINYLQMHIYNVHTKLYYCNVCQMKYLLWSSHARDQVCDVCNQYFECKYQLEEHYYSYHEDFHKTHCRICKRKLSEHFTFSEDKYQCCLSECKNQYIKECGLITHLYSHSLLKIFKCEVCGNHFKQPTGLSKHLRDIHPLCESCRKRFLNIFFLNEHSCEEQSEEFSKCY